VACAFAILSTTWAFLYDREYQGRQIENAAGKTVEAARLELTEGEVHRVDDLMGVYSASALFLLLAVALAVVHHHQPRVGLAPQVAADQRAPHHVE
jgi:hypothetical protein